MDRTWWLNGVRVPLPAEERAEAEMLYDGELGEHFCVVHFDHALGCLSSNR